MDRIALTAAAFGIPCRVLLNKSDRWNEEARSTAEHWREVYAAAGIEVWFSSALSGDGLHELAVAMNEGTQLLTGYSGAGKSSLLNALFPGLGLPRGHFGIQPQRNPHHHHRHPLRNGNRIRDYR